MSYDKSTCEYFIYGYIHKVESDKLQNVCNLIL